MMMMMMMMIKCVFFLFTDRTFLDKSSFLIRFWLKLYCLEPLQLNELSFSFLSYK